MKGLSAKRTELVRRALAQAVDDAARAALHDGRTLSGPLERESALWFDLSALLALVDGGARSKKR